MRGRAGADGQHYFEFALRFALYHCALYSRAGTHAVSAQSAVAGEECTRAEDAGMRAAARDQARMFMMGNGEE